MNMGQWMDAYKLYSITGSDLAVLLPSFEPCLMRAQPHPQITTTHHHDPPPSPPPYPPLRALAGRFGFSRRVPSGFWCPSAGPLLSHCCIPLDLRVVTSLLARALQIVAGVAEEDFFPVGRHRPFA